MSDLPSRIETVVVGAGQAGLTMSAYMRQAGREHVVLERRETLGGGWQDRWDRFRLVTPNWCASFADFPYDGDDPDGFMPRDEVAARVARYATVIDAPVSMATAVERVGSRDDGRGLVVRTDRGSIDADRVVVATGGFHRPRIPPSAGALTTRVHQVHSHDYRREADLPPGGVLVVGSGQTGVQLAEELHAAGRRVVLSVGHCGGAPRRYRGQDFFHWLWALRERGGEFGVPLPTVDTLPDPRMRLACNPHLSGHGGGHDTDLRRLGRDGITLVGRFEAVDGEVVRVRPDLADNLHFSETFFEERFRQRIDTYIERAGIDAPSELLAPTVAFEPTIVETLDLAAEGIGSVIWTSGYRLGLDWIDLPIFDELGFPRQQAGVSDVPALAFLGLPWLVDQGSATLFGVRRDGAELADRLERAR